MRLLVLLLVMLLGSAGVHAQGVVLQLGSNPPSGASSQHLALFQVVKDKRVPISSLPFEIVESGSYFVTQDLVGSAGQSGITISAAHVTLDLNGFSLVGVDGSLDGILVQNDNVAISNGTVRSWDGTGVEAKLADNGSLRGLRLLDNGRNGISGIPGEAGCWVRNGWSIQNTLAFANGDHGLRAGEGAVVRDCIARLNGGEGIVTGSALVVNCMALSNRDGITVFNGSTVIDCVARSNVEEGFLAHGNSFVHGCVATGNSPNYSMQSGSLSFETHQ